MKDATLCPRRGSRLLLIGASVRAAAQSARRAGIEPIGVDLFADRDLADAGQAHQVPPGEYPRCLARIARGLPHGPWMYTGAMENHPALVDEIAHDRPLWGIPGPVLRAVRNPLAITEVLECAGLRHPAVRDSAAGLPRDGSWLVKPLASGAGLGIGPLIAQCEQIGKPCYYQERIEGTPLGAVFLGDQSRTQLVGASWQCLGRPGAPFGYRGSIGPWPMSADERGRIAEVGRVLASAFGLRGLFGIDLILKAGWPWPVEVNPRYCASVEVLELALGRALVAEHRAVFEPGACPIAASGRLEHGPASRARFVGKAILYAEAPLCFSYEPGRGRLPDPFRIPALADFPRPGTRFHPGDPVVTVLSSGPTFSACRARLDQALARWSRRLHACTIP